VFAGVVGGVSSRRRAVAAAARACGQRHMHARAHTHAAPADGRPATRRGQAAWRPPQDTHTHTRAEARQRTARQVVQRHAGLDERADHVLLGGLAGTVCAALLDQLAEVVDAQGGQVVGAQLGARAAGAAAGAVRRGGGGGARRGVARKAVAAAGRGRGGGPPAARTWRACVCVCMCVCVCACGGGRGAAGHAGRASGERVACERW
jgi:hypothetical protein